MLIIKKYTITNIYYITKKEFKKISGLDEWDIKRDIVFKNICRNFNLNPKFCEIDFSEKEKYLYKIIFHDYKEKSINKE